MNGADLLNNSGTDDILALLNNSNFEPPFDFGMLYSTDGNPIVGGGGGGGSGVNGSGLGGETVGAPGTNGMFGASSPMSFGASGSGSGAGLGGGGYDSSKDTRNGQSFQMGTV
ncbi:hypothetical protein M408DRAFT_330735 [Serendipita vermifera MAFF 305830]|uniref:Uncharacterized protein n=1 Tax=Serendipita vermifera MAFF 305830 TaxID=933852 RepID=A0A0C3B3V8_SERVB|nr:hypothetical protein M408DRAFT_330735 [Serendipita vermifera MAFF 305830]